MIIYNVTSKVEASIAESWLQWMQHEHIPEVMATGCFTGYKILRLLEIDDTEGPTYAVQYHTADMATYERYIGRHAAGLRKAAFDRWGNNFISFRSVMQEIH